MWSDPSLTAACVLLALLVALPALLAGRRRRLNRELSEVATQLIDFAAALRQADRRLPVEKDALIQRFLWHVPLSLLFTVTYTYFDYLNLVILDAPRDPSLLAGGILTAAREAAAAQALLTFLRSSQAAAVIKSKGFDAR